MTPEHWRKVREIIASALELAPAQRRAYLENACDGDQNAISEIESMIRTAKPMDRLVSGEIVGNQYVIDRKLGRGGFGETYLARDTRLQGRSVVLKVLYDSGSQNSADLANEVNALARIDHPGVVVPLDTGVLEDGRPYLVMQFVDGSTLAELIPQHGQPLSAAARIVEQIGDALAAVHAHCVLHRDLKPTNIMVQRLANGNDYVRLIDFGIARLLDNVGATSVLTQPVGTLDYMAPEQFLGRSSRPSDIYAMSVVAYELVTGKTPRKAAGASADTPTPFQIIPPRTLRPELPETAESLILSGLNTDETKRPADAAAYGRMLSAALGSEARPGSKRTPLVAACLILLAAIAVLAGLRQITNREAPQADVQTVQPTMAIALRVRGAQGNTRLLSAVRPTLFQDETFRIELLAEAPGHAYIFAEPHGPNAPLTVLFPSDTTHARSSAIPGNKPIVIPEKDPLAFRPGAGVDRMWIVWCEKPDSILENVSRWATKPYAGDIGDPAEADSVRRILAKWQVPLDGRNGRLELTRRAGSVAGALDVEHR